MILEIAEIGNPVLREVAEQVTEAEVASSELQNFIDDLIETNRHANGAGLAANQVSVLKKIFVVEVDNNPRYSYKPNIPLTVVINPRITLLSEERFESYEGCLSIPNLRGKVERCPEIRVEGLDRYGKPLILTLRGISAGTFQHENDHLDGILFPDRVKDTKSFCTWKEFEVRYEQDFKKAVKEIIAKYGS